MHDGVEKLSQNLYRQIDLDKTHFESKSIRQPISNYLFLSPCFDKLSL